MGLVRYGDKKVKKLGFWDLQFIKTSVFFFAFWIVSFFSIQSIAKYQWLWFALFLIFAIKPILKALKK